MTLYLQLTFGLTLSQPHPLALIFFIYKLQGSSLSNSPVINLMGRKVEIHKTEVSFEHIK